MAKTDPTMKVDIKGLQCPKPLTWAKCMLDTLQAGDTLEVLATDPATVDNFQAFTRVTGHELVEALRNGKPSIEVARPAEDKFQITTWMMVPGQEEVVAKRVKEELQNARV